MILYIYTEYHIVYIYIYIYIYVQNTSTELKMKFLCSYVNYEIYVKYFDIYDFFCLKKNHVQILRYLCFLFYCPFFKICKIYELIAHKNDKIF